jgi:two-component system, OmpR family, sensor histidine kinase MtrB
VASNPKAIASGLSANNNARADADVKVTRLFRSRGRDRSGTRGRRLGLPARVALAWALGAALLTSVVGGSSYAFVRKFLLEKSTEVTSSQAYSNARVVRDSLSVKNVDIYGVLNDLNTGSGSSPLVRKDGDNEDEWYGTVADLSESDLTDSFLSLLDAKGSGRQRFFANGEPVLAVGVTMPTVDAAYIEIFRLDSLQNTLSALRNSLLAGTAFAIVVGATLGAWSARRVLRPLSRVARAAESLANGALDTRLTSERDTELNSLVGSFNTMVDAVQRRIEREERFASDVSHELRTPLHTLSAAAEVLERRRADLPEKAQQAVDLINSQLRKLSQMVLDLLEIARIDAGVADVHLEEAEMVALTKRVVSSLAVSPDLVVVEDGTRSTIAIVDRRRYEQVLRNLVDNASKYGDGVAAIRISGGLGKVMISVDDGGPGVGDAERQRIFERFSRGRAAHDVPGTGLGLSLASDQARTMGAAVSVSRSPEGGARFSIRIPAAEP